jgi:hypothetical protein
MTIDPADLIVTRTVTDHADCPVKDCPVSLTESREQGSSEPLNTVGGYVRGKLIKALEAHIATTHHQEQQ